MTSRQPQSEVDFAQQQPPCVLVVDDELSNRMLLKRLLMSRCHVIEAQDGREALTLLEQESVDLVLLDIMMPEMSGLDVLEAIRHSPETADLPVILVTALSETENIVKGLQLGANDYIVKPLDIDVVSARVYTHLQMKHMMDVYRQSIAELEAAQRMKDRLFRIASHDLKSPLANVSMAETLLRQMMGGDSTTQEILDTLRMTVYNMNMVIEEFLDMEACQSGGIDVHLQTVSVEHAVMEVIGQYNITAQEKNIALEVGHLPGAIVADPARLGQVLSNLVSNAIKYSPPHSTVTLWAEDLGGSVRIHVADQGEGIPADERQKLFKEFSKLSTRPTGGESSTGLGLWIVKHLVTLQQGTVDVECPPDGGSVFWVEFPAA